MTEQNKRDRPKTPQGAKALRGVAITLMGLTLVFTLLGGVGTTCVALGAEKYDSMALLVPYKPLYQVWGVEGVPECIGRSSHWCAVGRGSDVGLSIGARLIGSGQRAVLRDRSYTGGIPAAAPATVVGASGILCERRTGVVPEALPQVQHSSSAA